jgi:flagellar basal body-associated protein FliL
LLFANVLIKETNLIITWYCSSSSSGGGGSSSVLIVVVVVVVVVAAVVVAVIIVVAYSFRELHLHCAFRNTKDRDIQNNILSAVLYGYETWPLSLRKKHRSNAAVWF